MMRVAFVSPMPPSKSGIADYSAALLDCFRPLVDVQVFSGPKRPRRFRAGDFDWIVYQIGNNPHHEFVYEMALEHPGVNVIHDVNLHHLITDLTIGRGDWDGYLRELEYNGGPTAVVRGLEVRANKIGPDYEGVPMLRRLIETSRGIVVHSRFAESRIRKAGYSGPLARIPHGAWIVDGDRMVHRARLGVHDDSPLVGIFGYLKPYKRISQSLRAFRRLARVDPRVKMILAGEPHASVPLRSLIAQLGLAANVRVPGFLSPEEFTGTMAACDIVINLRYPTVGESSGTLMRALGMGKPVLVSDVGAFSELPDDICFKVSTGPAEEDEIFEYLSALATRPDAARALGQNARCWAERECNWGLVARRYAAFLECLERGGTWIQEDRPSEQRATKPERSEIEPGYVLGWAVDTPGRSYVETHLSRLEKTLEITPPGQQGDRILEMGIYFQITPALKTRLGYSEVSGSYYGPAGKKERKEVVSENGERFACEVDFFDAEKDRFPYPDGWFATVLCCEILEHLATDPMHMMAEINRILRPGGHLVLTTPNIASLRALAGLLQGHHPGFFSEYPKPAPDMESGARHNREYAPAEIPQLMKASGFELLRLESGPFHGGPRPELVWVRNLLERYRLPMDVREDCLYALARKTGLVRERYPAWLYSGTGE